MALHTRRAVLSAIGAGAVGLAGCTQPGTTTKTSTPTVTATDAPDQVAPAEADLGGELEPRSDGAWPQPNRTASKTASLDTDPGFTSAPSVAWSRTPTTEQDRYTPAFTTPVVVEDEVYTVRTLRYGTEVPQPENHYLTALRPDGEERWIAPVTTTDDTTPVPTAAAVHDDVLVVGVDELMQAFERSTGDQIWSVVAGGRVAGVTPTPEQVFVRTKRSVAAMNVGGRRWRTELDAFPATLAVGAEAIYVTAGDQLHRLDPDSGEVAWSRGLPESGDEKAASRLLTVSGGVIARQQSGQLAAYTTAGSLVWQTNGIADALATDGETLYAGRPQGVRAFDIADGTVVWERSCSAIPNCSDGAAPVSLAITPETVYVPLGGDQLVALASDDGSVRWHRSTPTRTAHVALTGDAVYAVGGETDPLVRYAE